MRNDFVPCREFAFRITAASVEQLPLPAAALENLTLFALRARDARLHRLGLQPLDSVAIRISRASEELAKARTPAHHRLAALLANLVGRHRRRGRFERDVALLVAPELAGIGAFGVVRASQELAVAPPFDHHVAAVELALEAGR